MPYLNPSSNNPKGSQMANDEYAIVFKHDTKEYRFFPGRITGTIAKEFRKHFGISTRVAFDEFALGETRDVDSWVKLVWLADRTDSAPGNGAMTVSQVEELVGTAASIAEHWTWDEETSDLPATILENTDPES